MQALLLVGGLGTRLRPVVADLPKVMAPVAGRPFLEYPIEQLRRAGVADLVLAVGYLADAIRDHFGDGARHGVRIRYSVEETPQGTAGALRLARPLLGEAFFVLNGDTFVELDCAAMARAHEHAGTVGAIALREVPDASRYGSVETDDAGGVRRFREKAASPNASSPNNPASPASSPAPALSSINAGVYRFTSAVFDAIPAIPPDAPASLEHDVLPALADRSQLVAFRAGGYFIDIGLPETLAAFETDIQNNRVPGL
jgi:NDP-sugar pyrophosphorylase family protein